MKIAHVTQPTHAGVAAVVASLVNHQTAGGHEVAVLCPVREASGPLRDAFGLPGVDVVQWDASREPGPSILGETRALRRALRAWDPDVVVLHSAKAGLAGRLALRSAVPTVFVPHAWSFEAATGPVKRLSRLWERTARRWCDIIVCVSAAERDRGLAAGIPGSAMTIIDNGVDVGRFLPGDAVAARSRLGLPECPTVVCVGRLTRQKGQDRLLRAWPRVRAAHPTAHLVLVGDGPDRPGLEGLGVDGVSLVGAQDDPRDWYQSADVVAMTSRWEAGALVPLEAMASERSVIAVDATGVRDALAGTGTVVSNGDDEANTAELVRAISDCLRDPAGTREKGRAARRSVMATRSLHRSMVAWDELMTEVAS